MTNQRVDWRAIPERYRAWRELPAWRKAVWLVTRSLTILVGYAVAAAVVLWYNLPETARAVSDGREPVWELVPALAGYPALAFLLVFLLPVVAAAVILPHRTDWSG